MACDPTDIPTCPSSSAVIDKASGVGTVPMELHAGPKLTISGHHKVIG